MSRTHRPTRTSSARLEQGPGEFKVRYPSHGHHVEADLTHQVLALIDTAARSTGSTTTSSGKPSTPTVHRQLPGLLQDAGDQRHGMVDSSYFIRGYAIHGYVDVPTYNASHGCLRIPIPNAVPIYNWIGTGTPVDVYYR